MAAIFAAVNVVVKPALGLPSFPLLLLPMGLFLIVINAALNGLTAPLIAQLDVDGIAAAVIAFLVISAVTCIGGDVLGPDKD